MHDEHSPYYYLPGGRGEMGETAEHTVIREVQEELNITPAIIWPLWFNQAFFTDEVDEQLDHELCIYFLMDIMKIRKVCDRKKTLHGKRAQEQQCDG